MLDTLSAKSNDDVKSIDKVDVSTATMVDSVSAPTVIILPNGPVAAQSVDSGTGTRNPALLLDDVGTGTCNPESVVTELCVPVVPECTIPVKKPAVEETPSAVVALGNSTAVQAEVAARSSSSTDTLTPLEIREARHEVYVETLLKKQGVSDERRAQLRQERQQPTPAAPPPIPEPVMTLEDLQRQIAAHRSRHLAMDLAPRSKPPRKKKEKPIVEFVMPSLFD